MASQLSDVTATEPALLALVLADATLNQKNLAAASRTFAAASRTCREWHENLSSGELLEALIRQRPVLVKKLPQIMHLRQSDIEVFQISHPIQFLAPGTAAKFAVGFRCRHSKDGRMGTVVESNAGTLKVAFAASLALDEAHARGGYSSASLALDEAHARGGYSYEYPARQRDDEEAAEEVEEQDLEHVRPRKKDQCVLYQDYENASDWGSDSYGRRVTLIGIDHEDGIIKTDDSDIKIVPMASLVWVVPVPYPMPTTLERALSAHGGWEGVRERRAAEAAKASQRQKKELATSRRHERKRTRWGPPK